MCFDESGRTMAESTKQMEQTLGAKIFFLKWKSKKMLLIKDDGHLGFI